MRVELRKASVNFFAPVVAGRLPRIISIFIHPKFRAVIILWATTKLDI